MIDLYGICNNSFNKINFKTSTKTIMIVLKGAKKPYSERSSQFVFQVCDKPIHIENTCFVLRDLLNKKSPRENQGATRFFKPSTMHTSSGYDGDDVDSSWLLDFQPSINY